MKRIYAAAWLLALALLAAPSAWAATNQLTMSGAASGTQPSVSANGVDTNISIILTPKGTGGVGIGTTAPQTTLQVNGSIMMGTGTCASTTAGSIQYSGGAVQYCNGTSWANISSGGGGVTGSQYQMAYLSGTNTAIGDANITTDASNDLIVSGGTLSIGTTTITANALNLTGQSAETIDMLREYTASTAGKNLTIAAGGAVAIGTNLNGGNLILSSGIATGTGTSSIQFQTYPAGSSGTSDTTALTALTLSATGATGTTAATTLQANAGSGTNKNGGTLTLASGVSTGTGSSGINFNVYAAGTSGSTANTATTAVTIASNGNVGIGTTSPAGTLDVEGGTPAYLAASSPITLQAAAGNGVTGGAVNINAGQGTSNGGNGGAVNITSGSSYNTPGAINLTAGSYENGGTGTGGAINLNAGGASYTNSVGGAININAGNASYNNAVGGAVILRGGSGTFSTAAGGNIILLPGAGPGGNGNVGIGTTSPNTLLQIVSAPSGTTNYIRLSPDGSAGAEGAGIGVYFEGEPTGQTLVLPTGLIYGVWDGNGYGTERLTLQSSIGGTLTDTVSLKYGNVGIDTNSPMDVLDVTKNNSGGVGGRILTNNQAAYAVGNEADLAFKVNSTFGGGYYSARIANINTDNSNDSDLAFYIYDVNASNNTNAGSEKMRITRVGNVGIGTTSPGQMLSVAGTIQSTSGGVEFPDGSIQTSAVAPDSTGAEIGMPRWFGTWSVLAGGTAMTAAVMAVPNTIIGTPANADSNTAPFAKWTSAAATSDCAGIQSNVSIGRVGYNIGFDTRVTTDSAVTTSSRNFVGMTSLNTAMTATSCTVANSVFSNDTPSSGSSVYFRYSTGASDTNWMCMTCGGSGCTATSSGVAVATSTEYDMRIITSSSQVTFWINGSLVCTNTTNLPAAGTALYPIIGVNTLSTTAKMIGASHVTVTHN